MMTRKKQDDIRHLTQELAKTLARVCVEQGRLRDATGAVVYDTEVASSAIGRLGAVVVMTVEDEAERMKAYAQQDKAFMEAQHWHEVERHQQPLPRAA